MSKEKKAFKDTDFGKFINKVGGVLPEVGEVALSVIGGNYVGAVSKVGKMLKKSAETKEEAKEFLREFEMFKLDYEKEIYELEIADRQRATNMYVGTGHEMADKIANRVLTYNLWVVALMIVIEISTVIYIDDKILIAIISGTIGGVTTALLQERQQIINFFFGSSKGSKDKDLK